MTILNIQIVELLRCAADLIVSGRGLGLAVCDARDCLDASAEVTWAAIEEMDRVGQGLDWSIPEVKMGVCLEAAQQIEDTRGVLR